MLPLPCGPSEAIPEDVTTTSGAWGHVETTDSPPTLTDESCWGNPSSAARMGFLGKGKSFTLGLWGNSIEAAQTWKRHRREQENVQLSASTFCQHMNSCGGFMTNQGNQNLSLPAKAWESGELHSVGREIWGCKIHEHMLLHTPLTNTSQPSMCFPCLAPWATSRINDPKWLNACLSPSERQTKLDDPWMKNKVVTCSEQQCSMIKRYCHGRMDCPAIKKSVPGVMDLACRLSSWATLIWA